MVFPGFSFLSSLETAPHKLQCRLTYTSLWGWPADPFAHATWVVQKCTKRTGSAAALLSFPRVECCKETRKTIPLLTPNWSDWSEIGAAAVYAVYTIQAVSHQPTEKGSCSRRIVIYLEETMPLWVTHGFIQLLFSPLSWVVLDVSSWPTRNSLTAVMVCHRS